MPFAICLLRAIAFLDYLTEGLMMPILAAQVRKLSGNELYVGLQASIFDGCQLVSGPLFGSLSDLKGRQPVLTLTLIVCSLAYAGIAYTNSVFVILFMRVFLGIFQQTETMIMVLVADYEKNEHKQVGIYGQIAAMTGAGLTLGPLISGHIVESQPENGFTFIVLVVTACYVMNACVAFLLPNVRSPPRRTSTNVSRNEPQTNIFFYLYSSVHQSLDGLKNIKWSQYWDIFISKIIVTFALGVYFASIVLYLENKHELTPKHIGYVLATVGITGSISSFFIGYLNRFYVHDKDYSTRNFHVFLLFSSAFLGMKLSFNMILYFLCLIPLSVGIVVSRLVILEMLLKRSRGDHVGTLIGCINSMKSLTGVVSPMISGLIVQYLGISYVMYVPICSSIIGAVLCYNKNKIKLE